MISILFQGRGQAAAINNRLDDHCIVSMPRPIRSSSLKEPRVSRSIHQAALAFALRSSRGNV